MIHIYLSITILCMLLSCTKRKMNDAGKGTAIDTIHSKLADTSNQELLYPNDIHQFSTRELGDFVYEIDASYDSLDELILQNTDSSNYISIDTDQEEGGMNAVWHFNYAVEIVRLNYHWAFESQQVELEFLMRSDTIVGYTRIDNSGYCQETQKWCIEKGGYQLDCDKTDSLKTNFDKQVKESFRDYKIELQQFLNFPIVESRGNRYLLKSDAEENEHYAAYVIIPKKLYDILVR